VSHNSTAPRQRTQDNAHHEKHFFASAGRRRSLSSLLTLRALSHSKNKQTNALHPLVTDRPSFLLRLERKTVGTVIFFCFAVSFVVLLNRNKLFSKVSRRCRHRLLSRFTVARHVIVVRTGQRRYECCCVVAESRCLL